MSKKICNLRGKVREKYFCYCKFFLSQLCFLNFLIWQYRVRSGDTCAYQQKVVSKAKKLMNCLVMYIWNLLDAGRSKINSVLMKRKIREHQRKTESIYNVQKRVTVISLEHWKKYTKKSVDCSTYSISFSSALTSINSCNSTWLFLFWSTVIISWPLL